MVYEVEVSKEFRDWYEVELDEEEFFGLPW
jgi:hypothetical protein